MTTSRPITRTGRAEHWDAVYDTRGEDGVSWFQAVPTITLELLQDLGVAADASIIDLGGGASVVVDHLLPRGFTDITILDVSKVALDKTATRLGPDARDVHWLHRDIFDWSPDRGYDLWHDRAVFHFLIDHDERQSYVRTLASGLAPGGRAIIATFDVDGPSHCSGLPVVRYGAEDLARVFAPDFGLVSSHREEHVTPAGLIQPFTWAVLTRL